MILLSRRSDRFRGLAERCGPKGAVRILHVSDLHNNVGAMNSWCRFAEIADCDLMIDTGDMSGIGGAVEKLILRLLVRPQVPVVFAPGNHDGSTTIAEMKRRGAVVLDRPVAQLVQGMSIWGYPDPNRTRLFISEPYRQDRCIEASRKMVIPEGVEIVAVHNRKMAGDTPSSVRVVFSGHVHSAAYDTSGGVVSVRAGSAGGGGPFGLKRQAAMVDLERSGAVRTHLLRFRLGGGIVQLQTHVFPDAGSPGVS